jgi:putative ATP-binding cassette transporter
LIVAPLFFDGSIEFGRVIQAGGVFGVVINALSIVVNHFGNLSNLAAVIDRLGSFWEGMDRAVAPMAAGDNITLRDSPSLSFEQVTIWTPKREQVLVRDLSFTMKGSSLLLCGPSGSGKSSILRVIAGLWETGSGVVNRPEMRSALFVPQRPYMVLGTLRSQLLYGVPKRGVLDRELERVLEMVRLTEMYNRVGGLNAVLDWSSILGTGEQQRIALARVLLIRPKVVFLDEATTAMDRATEEELYRLLPRFVERYVSAGSPSDLREYHEHTLQLNGDGTWIYE